MTAPRARHALEVPAVGGLVRSLLVVQLVALLVAAPALGASAASTDQLAPRLVPSERAVRPGDVITVQVDSSVPMPLIGGVNSYFERRRRDGSWQRLYMLHWYGFGDPSVRDANMGIEEPIVRTSPFPVVIPPVKPGEYRITRPFALERESGRQDLDVSGRVTVRPCPRGEVPRFGPVAENATDHSSLGTPGCTPK
jgi:hypothetical protein